MRGSSQLASSCLSCNWVNFNNEMDQNPVKSNIEEFTTLQLWLLCMTFTHFLGFLLNFQHHKKFCKRAIA